MPSTVVKNLEETNKLAQELAKEFYNSKNPVIIALNGPLGAGKTTFTQGFAKGLGVEDKITSPTFILSQQYPLKNGKTLHHLDLYRLENFTSNQICYQLGLNELFEDNSAIILIEWAAMIQDKLPKDTINLTLEIMDQDQRTITW